MIWGVWLAQNKTIFGDNYWTKYKVGIGTNTNKKASLSTLKLLLALVVTQGVQKLQVMGDSRIVIN